MTMQNEMRERLIEVLQTIEPLMPNMINKMADALIEAGVILPKFKIGQHVWFYSKTDEKIVCSNVLGWSNWGKGVDYALRTYLGQFLEKDIFDTEAKAKAALEKLEGK